jgi:hypothetical protein
MLTPWDDGSNVQACAPSRIWRTAIAIPSGVKTGRQLAADVADKTAATLQLHWYWLTVVCDRHNRMQPAWLGHVPVMQKVPGTQHRGLNLHSTF